jgi:murein DD-endopeptidase / murein LD-carboxypeptidase
MKTGTAVFYSFFLSAMLLATPSCHNRKETSAADSNAASENALKKKYANTLGVNPDDIKNHALYRFVDSWYGVPYLYGGKNKQGVDCSGFSCALYRDVYKKNMAGSAATLFTKCKAVKEKDLKEGDLVFFKIGSDKISHVGVYLQNNRFVHASTKRGVVISSLTEAYYQNYFFKGGRPE